MRCDTVRRPEGCEYFVKPPRFRRPEPIFDDTLPTVPKRRGLEGQSELALLGHLDKEVVEPGIVDGDVDLTLPIAVDGQPRSRDDQRARETLGTPDEAPSGPLHIACHEPARHALVRDNNPFGAKRWHDLLWNRPQTVSANLKA